MAVGRAANVALGLVAVQTAHQAHSCGTMEKQLQQREAEKKAYIVGRLGNVGESRDRHSCGWFKMKPERFDLED